MSFDHGDRPGGGTSAVGDGFSELRGRNDPFMAGTAAYSAFRSLFPPLLFALIVASTVGGRAMAELVVANAGRYLSPTGQVLLTDAIQGYVSFSSAAERHGTVGGVRLRINRLYFAALARGRSPAQ